MENLWLSHFVWIFTLIETKIWLYIEVQKEWVSLTGMFKQTRNKKATSAAFTFPRLMKFVVDDSLCFFFSIPQKLNNFNINLIARKYEWIIFIKKFLIWMSIYFNQVIHIFKIFILEQAWSVVLFPDFRLLNCIISKWTSFCVFNIVKILINFTLISSKS